MGAASMASSMRLRRRHTFLCIALALFIAFIVTVHLASPTQLSTLPGTSKLGTESCSSDIFCSYLELVFSPSHPDPNDVENHHQPFGGTTHDYIEYEDVPGEVPQHSYDVSSGLLTVNPNGPHPIFELTQRAEERWAAKLARASKTLPQAVNEYRRRYNRHPPLGFDHWWAYVQRHEVQLPDEYDAIYEDLRPYWGIAPSLLREMQKKSESAEDSVTIGKEIWDSPTKLLNITVAESRRDKTDFYLKHAARPHLDLLEEISQWIPPFRAVLGTDDRPAQLQDWNWMEKALNASKTGQRKLLIISPGSSTNSNQFPQT
jgi:hypothetical protein